MKNRLQLAPIQTEAHLWLKLCYPGSVMMRTTTQPGNQFGKNDFKVIPVIAKQRQTLVSQGNQTWVSPKSLVKRRYAKILRNKAFPEKNVQLPSNRVSCKFHGVSSNINISGKNKWLSCGFLSTLAWKWGVLIFIFHYNFYAFFCKSRLFQRSLKMFLRSGQRYQTVSFLLMSWIWKSFKITESNQWPRPLTRQKM